MNACDCFDAHCHLHQFADPDEVLLRARRHGVRRLVVNGTSPDDWDDVLALGRAHPDAIIPAIGLHPWFLEGAPADWLATLRDRLEETPTAAVGEIGLDRTRRSPKPLLQLAPLRQQLDLAAELGRPITLHCVGCWGRLLEEILSFRSRRTEPPPAIVIHDARPDPRDVPTFISQGCWLSVGGVDATGVDRLRAIPEDRLLVESDATPENGREPGDLPATVERLADLRETSAARLAAATFENAARVFKTHPGRE